MPLQVEPDSLFLLSLQKTVKHLTDTVAELCKEAKLENHKKVSIIRHKQKGIRRKNIPTTVANAIAYKYLQEVDYRTDLDEFTDVLEDIVHIFLPSGISELRIDWHWYHIGEILLKGNTCLRGINILQVLRRSFAYRSRAECMFQYTPNVNKQLFNNISDLCELILHDICSDRILSIVCKRCRSLQTLDVTGSGFVTDAVVEPVIELENLNKLLIKNTSITIKGTKSILRGLLACKKYKLNSFGCSELTQDILLMLAQFPNLRSLSTNCDFVEDKSSSLSSNFFHDLISLNSDSHEETTSNRTLLQSLQTLEIYRRSRFSRFGPELHVKYFGGFLLSLVLEAKKMDISHLARSCPVLLSLSLRTDQLTKEFDPTVTQFPSLRSLNLVISGCSPTALLSMCNNLTFLKLTANLREYTDIQGALFQSNSLKNLEVLFIASTVEDILVPVVRNFEWHCTKLRIIKVFGSNFLYLTETFLSFHGVKVSSELCSNYCDELFRTRWRSIEVGRNRSRNSLYQPLRTHPFCGTRCTIF
ncbi:uncharacterized protein [Periplaneta americana]|uniref:uncharacterized protein n=1 Tax=Periplaneta americana TaxID=6978 RepID=UPI0037E6FA8A